MWAVGVVGYEILVGELPFFSEYKIKVQKMIQRVPINELKICSSEELLQLLLCLLDKDPNTRITPS